MAQVTAQLVKQLREMTDAPMMECKKALVEADGDLDAAVDVLRKMGTIKAAKKAGRATNEGTVAAYISDDYQKGALVEVSCETDFVGTNPKFKGFASDVARVAAECNPASVDELLAHHFKDEDTVADALTEMIHTIGENMKIARVCCVTAKKGALSSYVHGGKLGVICEFEFEKPETAEAPDFKTFAHDVAMQVAAANPVAARRIDVPDETIEHEKAIYKAQAADSGKPEAIQEKMAEGRLKKFFRENVLTEQDFIKDTNTTIKTLAQTVSKSCDDTIEVVGFERFDFGA